MKESDDIMLWVCVATVFIVGVFVIGFGLGVCHGKDEYKNELHKQVKENNTLLKENIALIEKLKEVADAK
jgi:endonuclease III-like uncharacterized protein